MYIINSADRLYGLAIAKNIGILAVFSVCLFEIFAKRLLNHVGITELVYTIQICPSSNVQIGGLCLAIIIQRYEYVIFSDGNNDTFKSLDRRYDKS